MSDAELRVKLEEYRRAILYLVEHCGEVESCVRDCSYLDLNYPEKVLAAVVAQSQALQ